MTLSFVRLDEATPASGFELSDLPIVAGRSDQADWVLDDRWVSRLHCRIEMNGDGLFLIDLASKHGTFVNGEKITRSALQQGDRVSIGLCTFVLSGTAAAPAGEGRAEQLAAD